MKLKKFLLIISLFLSFINTSCQQNTKGRVYFNLDGGNFSDPNFSVEYIEGISNTPIKLDIPEPIKEGYTFVGWKEKLENGTYKDVRKILYDDGNAYYFYPYGNSTLYAYYEPLMSIVFHLEEESNQAELIAPVLGSYFYEDRLNGYTNLSLNSLDYLPTAKAQYKTFEYWYLKKPLIKEETESSTRYVVDESQDEGEYRFDTQFNLDTIAFPYSENKEIDLYAKWSDYPTITINFSLPEIPVYQFKAKNENIHSYLNEAVKEQLHLDFSTTGPFYYIRPFDNTYRFAGYYLDPSYKNQFLVSSSIIDKDLTIYLKWEKCVKVTLDYNGGSVDNKAMEELYFYQNDILTDDILSRHIPEREQCDFLYYALNDKKFDTSIPLSEDITLVAIYDYYTELFLRYEYPFDIEDEDQTEDEHYFLKKYTDISAYLENFKNKFLKDSKNNLLTIDGFYLMDEKGNYLTLNNYYIEDLMRVCLKVVYKQKLNVYSYTADKSFLSTSVYYLSKNEVLTSTSYNLDKSYTQGDKVYLPSSYYYDSDFTNEIKFPIVSQLSYTSNNETSIYIKMEEGIRLNFYDINNNPLNYFDNQNYLYVIKNSLISDEFKNMFDGKSLKIKDGSNLVNYFPGVSCDIIVF